MAKKRANLSDLLNNLTFRTVYDKYMLIAANAFEWSGLPDGILERHIERILFTRGKAVFFRDPDMDFMCLEASEDSGQNVYGDPLFYTAHGVGYHRRFSADDVVIIENNKFRIPTDPFIMFYANKITEAERTMDVNIKACKTPVIFSCDEADVFTWKKVFSEVDGNVPALFVDRRMNAESIQAFQTGVKFMGAEITDYVNSVESDLLTFLGVNNNAVDKRERLITSEADANNQLISAFAELQLEARERACKEINEKWGLSVTVKRRGVDNPVDTVGNGGDE